MKQCPKCRTAYPDSTLLYCLADGEVLVETGEEATVVHAANPLEQFPRAGGSLRVEIPQDASPVYAPAVRGPAPESGTSWLKIFVVVGIVGVMGIAALLGAGALIYFNKDARPNVTNTSNANQGANRNSNVAFPSPNTSPVNSNSNINSEADKLREQIANLEKKINEQKNSNKPPMNVAVSPDQPTVTNNTARVNSPGDGFLALRSLPSSDIGDRIVRIPHGSTVTLGGCLPRSRAGGKSGRWCRASYAGYTGWVYDAYLIY